MVRAMNLGANFSPLALRIARSTQTAQGIALRIGPAKADALLQSEVAQAIPRHQGAWDRNLAEVWTSLLTSEELRSLTESNRNSPIFPKFLALDGPAGTKMQALSQPLMTNALTEVLSGAMQKSSEQN